MKMAQAFLDLQPPGRRWISALFTFCIAWYGLAETTLRAASSETDELRKMILEMRDDYETRISRLED